MAEEAEDVGRTNAPRPTLRQRKSSFSDALSKFTSKTFPRRSTPAGLPTSTSTASMNPQSRLPTPAGIPKSSSFFSSLNSFATKSSSSSVSRSETTQPPPIKRTRKISERLAATPFFSLSSQQRVPTAPIPTSQTHRETTVKIETRGLMQPVAPPLPRSSTIANLATVYSSPQTPGYMRPTSSSAARRGSLSGSKQVNTPMPTIPSRQPPLESPTHRRRTPSSRYPVRKDSLPPAPISKIVNTGRRYSMLPTPVPQNNRHSVHEDPLESVSRKSSMKRRQLLRESETLPNMTVKISDGQDSGVAFETDDDVQRRFDQYNTTLDLSTTDQTRTTSHVPSTDDTEDTTASDTNEDTVLHRTSNRDPIPDPSNSRQVSPPTPISSQHPA